MGLHLQSTTILGKEETVKIAIVTSMVSVKWLLDKNQSMKVNALEIM